MTLDSDVLAVLETAKGWSAGDTAVGVVKSLSGSSPKVWLNGDSRRVFQWASVSKLLVAYASLLAVEEGTFALDDEAGPPGSTFRHLLAHASGLGPDAGPPLTRPGRRRIYSNAGYELVAALLSDKASMPFVEYLKAGVLDPLGMSSTDLPSGASPASGAEGNIYDLLSFTSELMR
ncbi:MAG TPA: serine hydrolase domain-containing protein, partial [Acidimicrobiales bacterium]|nr:serine hydrolase domain-containing protein [Acidimicrobiales bacterium]